MNLSATPPFSYLNPQLLIDMFGDETASRELVAALRQQLNDVLPQLREPVANFAAILHQLKGSIPLMCHTELSDLLLREEAQAKKSQTPSAEYAELVRQLASLADEAQQFLAP